MNGEAIGPKDRDDASNKITVYYVEALVSESLIKQSCSNVILLPLFLNYKSIPTKAI